MITGANQGGGSHQGVTPPQVAVSACSDKSRGDTCTFTPSHGDAITGTCRMTPKNSLACVPN